MSQMANHTPGFPRLTLNTAAQVRCERVERLILLFMLLNSVAMKPHKTITDSRKTDLTLAPQ